MSMLTAYWRRTRERRRDRQLRAGFDARHQLRYNLAPYVRDYGFDIGDYSYGDPVIRMMWSRTRLIVGKYCSIAPGVQFILGGNHHLDHVTTFPLSALSGVQPVPEGPFSRGEITIGSDVWIAADATVMSGVTVGHGGIVGACAVVASDVPPYSVVVGNPARILRKRFSDDIIAKLLDIRWWEFPDDQVRLLQPLLQSASIEKFIAVAEEVRAAISGPPTSAKPDNVSVDGDPKIVAFDRKQALP